MSRRRAGGGARRLNHVRRGEGEPLLLLHSLGGSLIQWSPVMDLLAAEREVIAVDMPGFGKSPELPEGVSATSGQPGDRRVRLLRVLGNRGKAGGRRHLAGRLDRGRVRAPGRRERRGRPLSRRVLEALARSLEPDRRPCAGAAAGPGPLLRPIMCDGARPPPGARPIHLPARAPQPGEAEAIARAYVTAPAYDEASALMRAGRVEDLKGIKTPITLAWAEHDTLVRNRPLRDGILPKRVQQVELPGCGHVPTWDDPDLVARVVLAGASRKR